MHFMNYVFHISQKCERFQLRATNLFQSYSLIERVSEEIKELINMRMDFFCINICTKSPFKSPHMAQTPSL